MVKAKKKKNYWIRPGIQLRHRTSGQIMTVLNLDSRKIVPKNGNPPKVLLMGVVCNWTADDGEEITRSFHSAELKPLENGD